MKNSQKGFIVPLLVVSLALLVIGRSGYIYLQNKNSQNQIDKKVVDTKTVSSTTTNSAVQSTSSSIDSLGDLSQSNTHSLPCGISLEVKTNQSVSTSTYDNGSMFSLHVGARSTTQASMFINCSKKTDSSQDVSRVIQVQADKSQEVNKNDYLVFDAQTLSLISKLYASKNYGYTAGSEVVGFENNGWIYALYFLNPDQARNQNSFEISVTK